MANKSIFFLLLLSLCGCASLKISHDLNESISAHGSSEIIATPIIFFLSKKENDLSRNEVKIVPFSLDQYKGETGAIREYGIFVDPKFIGIKQSPTVNPRIEIEIINTWFSENCYMGGCIFWPNLQKNAYEISFRVFDKNNTQIFHDKESITGELWGNIFKLFYGFKPLRQIDDKAPALLVKRSLARFQASEAFKKLTHSAK